MTNEWLDRKTTKGRIVMAVSALIIVLAIAGLAGGKKKHDAASSGSTPLTTTPAEAKVTCAEFPAADPTIRNNIATAYLDAHGYAVTITGTANFLDDIDADCAKLPPHTLVTDSAVMKYLVTLHGSRYRG
ncbi:MAG TPA: hypothetical protein VHC63_13540 [Acidimicrobiales bacterium]|nr:hypothetical protein [Acidimicrobiales bacterium]